MLSRFSALVCGATLGVLPANSNAFAQEMPDYQFLSPAPGETTEGLGAYFRFGKAVAINGKTALVGIPFYQPAEGARSGAGRVAVYTADADGVWMRTGTLEPDDLTEYQFGGDMAIQGKRLAVASKSAIHLYEQHGGEWQAQSTIHQPYDLYGSTLGPIAYDGTTLAFQRKQREVDPVTGLTVGRQIVVVYRIGPHGKATLVRALWGALGKGFGNVLAVRGDTLVVSGNSDAATYVYWNDHGYWRSEQKLSLGTSKDKAVAAVAIRGRHILLGAPSEERIPNPDYDGNPITPGSFASGAVHVFTYSQGLWRHTQRIRPDYHDPQIGNFVSLGGAVAAAGERVAIGATGAFANCDSEFGETYVYRWDGDKLVFDLHADNITGSSLSMTPRHLIIGTDTGDCRGFDVNGATVVDFGSRDPTNSEDDND